MISCRLAALLCALVAFSVHAEKECSKDPKLYKSTFADVAESAKDSVVNIASLNLEQDEKGMAYRVRSLFMDPRKDLFGAQMLNAPTRRGALGSGFIIKKEGNTYYVVTNHHVVDNTIALRIVLTDESIHTATLVGKDAGTDIAVLKFQTSKELKPLSWGDSNKLRIGDWSIVLGNPFGLGGTSLTTGVISYLARDLGASQKQTLVDNYIQTEAAINPGNSGGPLLNLDGEVIGVNTSIITTSGGSHNVGFAVPASLAEDVASNLIENRKMHRSWLGTAAQSLNTHLVKYMGLKDTKGALITQVIKGSPAAKAGIKIGDVIISINKKPIKKFSDLAIIAKKIRVGETADFEIIRNGETLIVTPTLEAYQDQEAFKDSLRFSHIKLEDHDYNDDFDFGFTPLTAQFRQQFEIADLNVEGVLVSDVKEEGLAEKFTFVQGDVIIDINGEKVRVIEDINRIIKNSLKTNPERPILFFLHRGGNQNTFVAIEHNTQNSKGSVKPKGS